MIRVLVGAAFISVVSSHACAAVTYDVDITQDSFEGAETINTSDLVVAPGFIDTRFRWTRPIGRNPGLIDEGLRLGAALERKA